MIEEDSIKFSFKFSSSKNVFYNPNMRFCRSMSSLAVGAIGAKLDVVDAFCASGIRGIRYAAENKNVKSLTFVDIEKSAIMLAKKNAKANRLKANAVVGNISRVAFELTADLLEIDPFGTPSPYLVDGFRFFNNRKQAYLSATATDVAVLCGGKVAPCLKNYHAKPLNNDFTHEIGLRILIKKIAETAAEFNMGIKPLVSFSDRHYLKTIVEATRSADFAYKSMKSIGHIWFCPSCGNRNVGKFPLAKCPSCSSKTDYAGPLWLGELHTKTFLRKMAALNGKRHYADKKEISNMLSLMENEVGLPPYYYNVHALAKMNGGGTVPSMEKIIERIKAKGYKAVRTHFSKISIKTDAPHGEVVEAIKWRNL